MNLSVALLASILGLYAGPLLLRALRGMRGWLALLDGYVFVTVGGLVVLELLPSSLAAGGVMAGVAAIAGLALPTLLEGRLREGHRAVVVVAVLGLALHAAADGSALAGLGWFRRKQST